MTSVIFRRTRLGLPTCRGIAKKMETDVRVITNTRNPVIPCDNVFRWGCTANYSGGGHSFFNKARAISTTASKGDFRLLLSDNELAPFSSREEFHFDPDVDSQGVIVRPNRHAQGRRLKLVKTQRDLRRQLARFGEGSYWSSYIQKEREFRVFCGDKSILCVVEKIPEDPTKLAWNHSQGSEMPNVRWSEWPMEAIKVSYSAFKLSGLDYCGVDVIMDSEGSCYVLEINSAPTLCDYRQGIFAKLFDHYVTRGKDTMEWVEDIETWKDVIHPEMVNNTDRFFERRGYVA